MSAAANTQHEALCQRAREFIRRRMFSEAIAAYEQVLQLDDRDIRAHEGIATAAFLVNDYERAERHFLRISQLDPRRADPLVNLGAVYNRSGDYEKATKYLRQALARNRKCAEAYYNLGIAHKGQNQLSMAVSAYKEAIRLAPAMAEAYQNLGNVYVELGNVQQAILNFRRALEIQPGFERAKRGLDTAQRLAQERAAQANPLGRLVDQEQLARQRALAEQAATLRELTDQERQQDRLQIHKLAGTFEHAAEQVLVHLKEQLTPALLNVHHTLAHHDDQRKLFETESTLAAALEQYRHAIALLLRAGDDLQAHEDELKRQLARQ